MPTKSPLLDPFDGKAVLESRTPCWDRAPHAAHNWYATNHGWVGCSGGDDAHRVRTVDGERRCLDCWWSPGMNRPHFPGGKYGTKKYAASQQVAEQKAAEKRAADAVVAEAKRRAAHRAADPAIDVLAKRLYADIGLAVRWDDLPADITSEMRERALSYLALVDDWRTSQNYQPEYAPSEVVHA